MAKKRASKIYKEDEEELLEKHAINGIHMDHEDDELMGINTALEQDKERSTTIDEEQQQQTKQLALLKAQQQDGETESAAKGVTLPPAKAKRDPKMDKDPIEGEDLGLEEHDFLLARRVTQKDLEIHNKVNQEGLLGSNVRKPRDLLSIFTRGMSSNETPKVDSSYMIENNKLVQKEVVAIQLLRNYHSRDNKEKYNTMHLFSELRLSEELIEEIKEDKKAYQNEDLITIIKELL